MADKESKQNTDSEHESPLSNSRVRIESVTLNKNRVRFEKLLQLKRSRSAKKRILTKALKGSKPSKRKSYESSNEEELWNSKQKSERLKLRS